MRRSCKWPPAELRGFRESSRHRGEWPYPPHANQSRLELYVTRCCYWMRRSWHILRKFNPCRSHPQNNCLLGPGRARLIRLLDTVLRTLTKLYAIAHSTPHQYQAQETHRRTYSEFDVTSFRLREALPTTPKSDDLLPNAAESKPSAASPLLNSSRTADARLGIRALKRKLSSAVSSSGDSMICRRSSRDRVTIDDTFVSNALL